MKPIQQSFVVDSRLTSGQDGVSITRVDLYFASKATTGGVELYIKEVENGIPLNKVIPRSRVVVKTNDIVVSDDGSEKTPFIFNAPVYLEAGKEYSFVVAPENGSPDFKVFTYEIGSTDLATGSVANRTFNNGNLYLSTDQPGSIPTPNEELKMRIFKANFGATPSGTLVVHNDNHEFFETSNVSNEFRVGEVVVKESTSTTAGVRISSLRLETTRVNIVDTLINYIDGTQTIDEVGNLIANYWDVNGDASIDEADKTLALQYYLQEQANFADLDDTFVQYIREHFIVLDDDNFNKTYVYGTATSFSSQFNVGDMFVVHDTNNNRVQANEIVEVVSDTLLAVKDTWGLRNANGNYGIANNISHYNTPGVVATVERYNSITGNLVLNHSNASNTTHLFANGDTLLGTYNLYEASTLQTPANCQINVVDNQVSLGQVVNSRVEMPLTSITCKITTNAGGAGAKELFYEFGENKFMDEDVLIKSRSNEIRDDAGAKSFTATFTLAGMNRHVSPQILKNPITFSSYKNIVQSTTTGETGINGDATTKFVSKKSTLPSDIEAEDIRIFMDAYRPANTYIDVYAKTIGLSDEEEYADKEWTLLTYTSGTETLRSSSTNRKDVKEFQLTFPTAPPTTDAEGSGTVVNGDANVAISNTTQFSVGDLVLINDVNDDDFFISTVTAIDAGVNITLANQFTYGSQGEKRVRIVSQKRAAFKYSKNDSIVRYYDGNLVPIDGYNQFALKFVLRSDQHWNIPRVENYRAITTSV